MIRRIAAPRALAGDVVVYLNPQIGKCRSCTMMGVAPAPQPGGTPSDR
jgi:hypothetical protein